MCDCVSQDQGMEVDDIGTPLGLCLLPPSMQEAFLQLGPRWASASRTSSHIQSHGQADLTYIPKKHRNVSAKASEAGQHTERWNNLEANNFQVNLKAVYEYVHLVKDFSLAQTLNAK